MIVLYPGSFDPPTRGHVDIAKRAAAIYDNVIVMVLMNPAKRSLISVSDRAELLKSCFSGIDNISVEYGDRLLADAVKRVGANAILRGLRSESDYESEKPVADSFLKIFGIETVFMQCDPCLGYVSSTMVRDLLRLGGDSRSLLPEAIYDRVQSAYSRRND